MNDLQLALRQLRRNPRSKAGLKLRPWEGEGDCKVTLDVGGRTVNEALKALIAQNPNAEGVVMIRTPNSGMAQRRYLPRPPGETGGRNRVGEVSGDASIGGQRRDERI